MKSLAKLLLVSLLSVATIPVLAEPYSRQEIRFNPSGIGEPITFSFNGFIRPKADAIDAATSTDAVAKAIDRVVKSNASGDSERILSLWAEDERPKIRQMLENADMLNRSSSLYKNIESTRIFAAMEYGAFLVVFVAHDLTGVGPYLKVYPLLKTGKDYLLTNQLTKDFLYAKFFDELARHLWEKQ